MKKRWAGTDPDSSGRSVAEGGLIIILGSGKMMFLMGNAMGEAMVDLLKK